ncbi:MAG TPA: metallophosphoesterase family protein [Acidimicrobiia bacterium]|nr:metallophosphoesterase family protein [Acidimicrobiia bacterium]
MTRRLAIFPLALCACFANRTGNTSAGERGDVSHPADRGSPIAKLREECGDGDITAAGGMIKRHPYLQQVTTTTAMVGWVAKTKTVERVDVTLPDGTPVESAPATLERAGQMWATLTNLSPDTLYCYSITDGQRLTDRTGFRTAPKPKDEPVRILAFGDSGGGGTDQKQLARWMADFPYDLIIHTGDIAYDDGSLGQFEDNVFGIYHELFRNVPFFPAAGNHEYKTLQGRPFRDVFALPGDSGEKWYSFDWGRVHFAALDTEADYGTQMKWLEQDLAASELPWKIVFLHRPPYSSGAHGSDTRLRNMLAPIVERHQVQLVLAGHDHDYERMAPQHGVNYIVTGGGGKGTYAVGHSKFTAFSEEVIHFIYLEVKTDEMTVHAVDATGAEFDSVTIPRLPA